MLLTGPEVGRLQSVESLSDRMRPGSLFLNGRLRPAILFLSGGTRPANQITAILLLSNQSCRMHLIQPLRNGMVGHTRLLSFSLIIETFYCLA